MIWKRPFSKSDIAGFGSFRPLASRSDTPALTLTVIHAQEQKTPKNRKKIEWKLLTDLPVQSRKDAIEKLEWYAMRWKIEMFHKILNQAARLAEIGGCGPPNDWRTEYRSFAS